MARGRYRGISGVKIPMLLAFLAVCTRHPAHAATSSEGRNTNDSDVAVGVASFNRQRLSDDIDEIIIANLANTAMLETDIEGASATDSTTTLAPATLAQGEQLQQPTQASEPVQATEPTEPKQPTEPAQPAQPIPPTQPIPPAQTNALIGVPQAGEPSIWLVDFNGRKSKEIFARTDGKVVYLPESVLAESGVKRFAPFPVMTHFKDGLYFLPDEIPNAQVKVDFDEQELHIVLPPDRLEVQTIDLSPVKMAPITPEAPWSAFLDYSYSESHSGNNESRQASLSPHLRFGGWSIYDDHTFQDSGSGLVDQRVQTVAFHDWPTQALRLSLGDASINTAELGRASAFFGVELQRNYALQPGFMTTQTASLSGTALTPSTADIYMDGILVGSTAIGAGPFNLQNLSNYGGLRDIQVIVRDASGAQQAYSLPFYFTNTLLPKGVDTFDIGAGQQRQSFGSGTYSGTAASGTYSYGLTDNFTVGLRGSSVPNDDRISPLVTARLGSVATATLIAASRWHDGQRNTAEELNLSSELHNTTIRMQWRHTTNGFDDVPQEVIGGAFLPDIRAHDAVSLAWSQGLGALGYVSTVASQRWRFDGKTDSNASVSWSHGLPGRGAIQVGALAAFGETAKQRSLFVTMSFPIGQRTSAIAGYRKTLDSEPQTYVQASQSVASDGGFGYRLYGSEQGGDQDKEAELTWKGKWAQLTGTARTTNVGPTTLNAQRVQINGALATVGGYVYAVPVINNAFAAVSVGYPDIRVYRSGSMIGKTDASGTILVPELPPYSPTKLRVEVDDLPLDVDLVAPELDVVPADGAGLLLNFTLPKVAAVTGNLFRDGASINNRVIELTRLGGNESNVPDKQQAQENKTVTSRTGNDGFFELEQMSAGSYRLQVPDPEPANTCSAAIIVPTGAPPVFQIGKVQCEGEKNE